MADYFPNQSMCLTLKTAGIFREVQKINSETETKLFFCRKKSYVCQIKHLIRQNCFYANFVCCPIDPFRISIFWPDLVSFP